MKFKAILISLLTLSIASCTDPISTTGATSEREPPSAAECVLFQRAFDTVKATVGKASKDIISGCPQNPKSIPKARQVKYQELTSNTPIPKSVKQRGDNHKVVFERLILRGTPASIAIDLTGTDVFAEAAKSVS